MPIKRYLLPLFTTLFLLLCCRGYGQLRVTVRLVSVTQTGPAGPNLPTGWKSEYLRLRQNGVVLDAVDEFGCVSYPFFANGATVPLWPLPEGAYTHTLDYYNGFDLNSWIHLYLKNHGWWELDFNICESFAPGQSWANGWTLERPVSITYFADEEGKIGTFNVVIEGQSATGQVVTHPYHYYYEVSYELNNVIEDRLVYKTTDGTTITSVCEGQQYRLELPYKNGSNGTPYSGGHFWWERKVPGGSWTPIHGEAIRRNYIDVNATFPKTEYRARLVSSADYFGDRNVDASFKSENNTLTVFPSAPTDVDYSAVFCGDAEPSIEIIGLSNAIIGREYRFSLAQVQPDGTTLPVGGNQPIITYTGQSPVVTLSDFGDAGDYLLYVTAVIEGNIGNCTNTFPIAVRELADPELTVIPSDVLCHGQNNGRIQIGVVNENNAAGDQFTYEIIDEASGEVLINETIQATYVDYPLPAGTYTVRVTNEAGCGVESSGYILNEPPDFPSIVVTKESTVTAADGTVYDAACRDGDAVIGVTLSGGVVPPDGGPQLYTVYVGNDPPFIGAEAGQQYLFNVSAAFERVIITFEDANGCLDEVDIPIVAPETAITIDPIITEYPSSCENNGEVDISGTAISGGLPPYEIYLNDVLTFTSPPNDNLILDGLGRAIHTIKVVDQLGCEKTEQVDLLNTGAAFMFSSTLGLPPSCNGYSDGEIQFSITGGNTSCIMDPDPCNPDDYWYKVNDGPFVPYVPDPLFVTLDNLVGGQYIITVRDADDCEISTTINISDPEPILISRVDISQPVPCRNEDATVTIHTTGPGFFIPPFEPYRDLYINGIFQGRYDNIGSIDYPLPPGTHTIQVVAGDDEVVFDCASNIVEVTIENPPVLEFNLDDFTDVSCPDATDGSVELSFTGGVRPYAIEIYTDIRTAFEVENYNANSLSLGNLAPICFSCGEVNYEAKITDDNGCEKFVNFVIGEPDPVIIHVVNSTSPTNCLANNGSLTLSASGGVPPYEFALNSLNFFSETFFQNAVADNMVYVRDANGCMGSLPVQLSPNTIPLTVSVPTVLQDDYSLCGGTAGSASFTVSGFADPLTVEAISCGPDPVLPTITVNPTADPSGEVRTITLENLTEGDHCFLVYDGFGCSEFLSTITIGAPAELTIDSLTATNESCLMESFDGTLTVEAIGGMPPYTYSTGDQTLTSSGAVTFTGLEAREHIVSVQDNLGCVNGLSATIYANSAVAASTTYTNSQGCPGVDFRQDVSLTGIGGQGPYSFSWEDGVTGDFRSELAEGNYAVTVQNANGCTRAFMVNVIAPLPLSLTTTGSIDNICAGATNGSVELLAEFGAGNYQYSINGTDYQSSATFSGLASGTYTGYVTDALNCVTTTAFEILTINDLDASTVATNVSCAMSNDGMIVVNPSGGTAPFEYAMNGGAFQNENEFTDLAPGTYSVVVRDEDNCELSLPDIIITEPVPLFSNAFETLSASCGQADGEAEVQVSGGTEPYSYIWDNNPALNTAAVSGLLSGTHTVVVTDANGCTNTETLVIAELPPPSIVNFLTTTEACDMADGTAQVIVTSGSPPFTYEWDNNPALNQATLINASAGDHTVVITDSRGCQVSGTVTIGEEPELLITGFNTIGSACDLDGEAEVLFIGGTPPYMYEWDNDPSLNQPILINAGPGEHSIVITDSRGCTQSSTVTIEELPELAILSFETTDEACDQQDGVASVVVVGGTPPYSYLWDDDFNLNTASVSGLLAGDHEVLITDSRGCELLFELTIEATTPLELEAANIVEESCGQQDGQAEVIVSGGTPPYTYEWNDNPAWDDPQLIGVSAGIYQVLVVDSRNCTQILDIEIGGNDGPELLSIDLVDEACGQSNGVIGVEIIGGTPPYTYEWSPSVEFEEGDYAFNLPAGIHTLTVTDANGCTEEVYQELYEIQGPILQMLTVENGSCGTASGAISAMIVGGTPPYSYGWAHDPSLEENEAVSLNPGDYFLLVEDALGCTLDVMATIEAEDGPIATLAQSNPSDCGLNNGSLAIGIAQNSGTPPFSYAWSDDPTATTSTREGLAPGDYTVTVSDANGCSDVFTASVIPADGVMISEAMTTPSACDQANGSASILTNGGQTPLTFSWSFNPAFNSPVANNLAPGSYVVTVTDAAGCFDVTSVEIEDAGEIELSVLTAINSNCQNGLGLIEVQTQGGLAPFSYTWSHDVSAEGPIQNDLFAGEYSITVIDANNCQEVISQSIEFQAGPQLSVESQANALCTPGNGGAITVSVLDGVPPYDFQWSHDSELNEAAAVNLVPGDYAVTVEDINGCVDVIEAVIELEEGPTSSVLQQQNSCGGVENGSLLIGTTGGTGALEYEWSHDAGLDSPIATNLSPGDYNLIVSDQNGCTSELSATIIQLELPSLALESVESAVCTAANGQATVMASGGTGPYHFAWSHDAGLNSATATDLIAGAYQVTVTDFDGCSDALSLVVDEQNDLSLDISGSMSLCEGTSGFLNVTAVGGTAPFDYSWSHDPQVNSEQVTGLSAGDFSVTVIDTNGCTQNISTSIESLEAPSVAMVESTPTDCNGATGSISVQPVGGLEPYSYSWSHDAGEQGAVVTNLAVGLYTLSVTDAQGCIHVENFTIQAEGGPETVTEQVEAATCGEPNGSAMLSINEGEGPFTINWYSTMDTNTSLGTTNILIGQFAGDYLVEVIDVNGCINTSLVEITEIPEMTLFTETTAPLCSGDDNGEATVSVISGGIPPYTYAWSNGQTGAMATGLVAGVHSVSVTDMNGCVTIASAMVLDTEILSTSVSLDLPACESSDLATATVVVTGGTAPYSYQWNDTNTQTTATASNLVPGSYEVLVQDANDCFLSTNVEVPELEALSLLIESIQAPACDNSSAGAASITASGGSGDYTYQWNDPLLQTTPVATDLAPGTYTVQVQDQNSDCTATLDVEIPETAVIELELVTVTQPTCTDDENGSISIAASGGSGEYTYQWNDPYNQMTPMASGLTPGDYTITVFDNGGCSTTQNFVLTAEGELLANISAVSAPTCDISTDGMATVTVVEGSGNYNYQWNDPLSQTGATAENLPPGTYLVLVEDDNGCSVELEAIVPTTSSIDIEADTSIDPTCSDTANGILSVSASGGDGDYTYTWDDPDAQNTAIATDLLGGSYTVTVMDGNNCFASATFLLEAPEPIEIAVESSTNESCVGENDGIVTTTASGGTGVLSFAWDDPAFQLTPTASNLPPGTYTLLVTDENNCQGMLQAEIQAAVPLELAIEESLPSCAGDANGALTAIPSGGAGMYTYVWNDAMQQTTATAADLGSGFYGVTVTDVNNCETTLTTELVDPEPLSLTYTTVNINCVGVDDGSISAIATGGTGTISYQWDDPMAQTTATATSLAAGTYQLLITDENGCELSEQINILDEAVPLEVLSEVITDPTCEGATNGSIIVDVEGGAGELDFLWSSGATNSDLTGVPEGTYQLSVTDANGCVTLLDYVLTSQAIASIDLGEADTMICAGQVLIYDFTEQEGNFDWNGPGGFSSSSPSAILEMAGQYTLMYMDTDGCIASDTIELSFAEEAFQAFFVAPTHIVAGDTIAIVEVSWPIPGSVAWSYDQDSLTLVGANLNEYYFTFPYAGNYDLTLAATLGGCTDLITKTIQVFPDSASLPSPLPPAQQEILLFELNPNPNDGNFTVEIELSSAKDIVLSVYDINGNQQDQWIGQGAASYNPSFSLGLVPGTYVLLLQTPRQRKSIVFTVFN